MLGCPIDTTIIGGVEAAYRREGQRHLVMVPKVRGAAYNVSNCDFIYGQTLVYSTADLCGCGRSLSIVGGGGREVRTDVILDTGLV